MRTRRRRSSHKLTVCELNKCGGGESLASRHGGASPKKTTEPAERCVPYLSGGALSETCCEGLKSLKKITPTKADRQKACQCLKDAAARVLVKIESDAELPGKCGVETGIPISPQIDCKRTFR
uniref:Non-specific lipid-transfer protein n=1 Tax=Kalanchoe fedtschenkoi TaxID=63787 RepID=A0A7N0V0L1_KALFE